MPKELQYMVSVASLFAALAGPLLAEETPDAVPPAKAAMTLTLAEALDLALEANIDVKLATEKVKESESQTTKSRSSILPSLSASLMQKRQDRSTSQYGLPKTGLAVPEPVQSSISYPDTPDGVVRRLNLPTSFVSTPDPVDLNFRFSENTGPLNFFYTKLNLVVPLLNMGNVYSLDGTKVSEQRSHTELDVVSELIFDKTITLYNGALISALTRDALQGKLELEEGRTALTADLMETGVATELQYRKEKLSYMKTEQDLKKAEQAVASSHRELKRLLGLDPDVVLELVDKLAFKPMVPMPPEEAAEVALEQRPDLRAQFQHEKELFYSHASAKAQRYPTISGFGNFGREGEAYDDTTDGWFVGVFASLPLWDFFKRKSDIEIQESHLTQAKLQTRDMEQGIRSEIFDLADDLVYAESAVVVADEEVQVDYKNLMMVQDQVDSGSATPIDLASADVDLTEAKVARNVAVYVYETTVVSWYRALGRVAEALKPRPVKALWNPGPDLDAKEADDGVKQDQP